MSSETKSALPERFWAEFRAVLSRHSVSPKAAAWYVKRAKHFLWEHDLPTLHTLTPEGVSACYRASLCSNAQGRPR